MTRSHRSAAHDPPDGRIILGGKRRSGESVYELIDPYTGDPFAESASAGMAHVDEAVETAARGHLEMAELPLHKRIEILERAAQLVAERRESLAVTVSQQTGKALKDSMGEVGRSTWTLRAIAAAAREMRGEVVSTDVDPAGAGLLALVLKEPIGIVAAITPFNAPFNIATHKVAAALVVGNSVILKPAIQAPISGLQLAEILLESGLPPKAISVLPGGPEVGARLASSESVGAVSLTGGVRAGRSVAAVAAHKRLVLELGGNSANIVCSDANIEWAASTLVAGAYANSGQACNSVQRVLVEESVYDHLAELVVKHTSSLRVGDPLDEATDIGTLVDEAAAVRVESWVREAVAGGATELSPCTRSGAQITPTVLGDVDPDMRVACEEVFGPVMVLIKTRGLDEAITYANATPFGLQASVFTESLSTAMSLARQLRSGGVMVNRSSKTRLDHLPFGGIGSSGVGREGGRYSLEEFTYQKLVLVGQAQS